jgi:hypothetical protein
VRPALPRGLTFEFSGKGAIDDGHFRVKINDPLGAAKSHFVAKQFREHFEKVREFFHRAGGPRSLQGGD